MSPGETATERRSVRASRTQKPSEPPTPEATDNGARSVVVPMATAAVAAAAGVVGGVVLDRTKLSRNKRVLGMRVPGTGRGMDGLARQVGEAGKQLGRLANEVKEAREKAERVGRAFG